MTRAIALAILLLGTLFASPSQTKAKAMTPNQKSLNEARERIEKFEAEREPERLREAYMALENVDLLQEGDSKARALVRSNCLSLWLELVQTLDRLLDPKFDAEDVPENLVQPPPTKAGVVYPPGADPALIDDPKARAEYEKAIAANQAKQVNYRLQLHLRRLNERIPPRAEAFIRSTYTKSAEDQKELATAIGRIIKDPRRKASLLKASTAPQP